MLASRCETTADIFLLVFQTCFKLFCIRIMNINIYIYVYIFAYCHLFSKSSKGVQTLALSESGGGHLLWVDAVEPLTQHVGL